MVDHNDLFTSTNALLKRIDRYRVADRIGTGGMARVYRGQDIKLDRDVAIKILHEHLADDSTFRARFEREAKFLASFNHPNIIQIFDYATIEHEDRHLLYMVMTYLPGPNLKDIIEDNMQHNRLMPRQQVLQIIEDIAAALDYAHQLGMVHRDIKPANILFDEAGRAVLTDFGIARMIVGSNLTQEDVAVGTPAYMSPEQAAGEQVDGPTDIYALGIILYELLAGEPPFGDDGSLSVLLKHLSEPVPPLTSYSHIDNEYLDRVIGKALAKRPEERYQVAPDMALDLARALRGEEPLTAGIVNESQSSRLPAITRPNTQEELPAKPPRQNSAVGILVAGLLVIATLVFGSFWLGNVGVNSGLFSDSPMQTEADDAGVSSMVQSDEDAIESMTVNDNTFFTNDFNADDPFVGAYWPIGIEEDSSRNGTLSRELGTNSTYNFTNSINNRAATTILEDFRYTTDIEITATMTLDASSPASTGYGIVFHYIDRANYGVFAVDGNGNFSIWYLEDRRWRELRALPENEDWTANDAVNHLGEPNELRLQIVADMLVGYVNDVQVVELTDGTFMEGGVGLYLATPSMPEGDAAITRIDTFAVDRYDSNTNPSMTAGSDTDT
jgi:serine/threonine protein kinase